MRRSHIQKDEPVPAAPNAVGWVPKSPPDGVAVAVAPNRLPDAGVANPPVAAVPKPAVPGDRSYFTSGVHSAHVCEWSIGHFET